MLGSLRKDLNSADTAWETGYWDGCRLVESWTASSWKWGQVRMLLRRMRFLGLLLRVLVGGLGGGIGEGGRAGQGERIGGGE